MAIVTGQNDRPVDSVEHEFKVRDTAWVVADELEDTPKSEDIPGLEGAVVVLNIGPTIKDDKPEVRGPLGSFDHFLGDTGGLPWAEVLMDPPEVARARRGGGERGVIRKRRWELR